VRDEILEKHPETIQKILEIINQTTSEFKDIPSIDNTLASRYHQKTEDIPSMVIAYGNGLKNRCKPMC